MKNYFIQYKTFLLFLSKFLLVYLVLTFCYEFYLEQFNIKKFEVDSFTVSVAKQTKNTLLFFNQNVIIKQHPLEASIQLWYNNHYIARIIEGCNAITVMILFLSFVVAFTGKFKNSFWFILFGLIFIHLLNIGRIATLTVLLFYFPNQQTLLHDILFPILLYGAVFFLWIVWVNYYSIYAKQNFKK